MSNIMSVPSYKTTFISSVKISVNLSVPTKNSVMLDPTWCIGTVLFIVI